MLERLPVILDAAKANKVKYEFVIVLGGTNDFCSCKFQKHLHTSMVDLTTYIFVLFFSYSF